MTNFRIGLLIFAMVTLVVALLTIDYNDLFRKENIGSVLTVIALILVIISIFKSSHSRKV